MDVKKKLFRKEAVDQAASPDQLDQLIKVTSPANWLLLIIFAVALCIFIAWAFLGKVERTITAPSIVYPKSGGPLSVVTDHVGYVNHLAVNIGEQVKKDQVLMSLASEEPGDSGSHTTSTIRSPYHGTVLDLAASLGQRVVPGTPVALVQPAYPNDPLVVHAFIPPEEGKRVKPGMKVRIALNQVNSSHYGYLVGTVESITLYPLTKQGLLEVLQNPQLASIVSQHYAPFEALITLTPNKANPTGYRWTSERHYPGKLTAGSLGKAMIITKEVAPINYLIPHLEE